MAQLSAMTAQNTAAAGVQINQNVVAPMQAASAATQNLIRDIGDLGKDIQNIPEPPLSAFGVNDPSGGASLGGARSALRAGGFLLGAEAGGGALRAAGQAVTLGSVFGVVGVAAAGLAIGLRALTSAEQAATDAAKARLDIERQVAHEVGDLTTKQIQERRDAAQKSLVIDQDVARQQLASSLEYKLSFISDPLKLAASIAGLDAQTNAWNDEIAQNNVAIAKDKATIDAYTAALNTNAGAAATAAVAEEVRSKQQVTDANRAVEISKMTSDQRQQQAAEENNEIKVIGEYIKTHHLSAAAVQELTDKQYALIADVQMLTDATDGYADALARVAQRADAVNSLFDALTAEGEAEQKVAQARQDVADAATEHADKLRQIDADEADKEAADRAKSAQQAEDDQAKHLQKLADIDAQYAADHEAAVGNRDALANYQAAQKRDKDTTKENDAYALQEQQLAAHLADQLVQDQAAQQKQIDAENASYRARNGQLIRALNDAQVEESRAAGRALAYQRQANDTQLNERIRANNVIETVQQAANIVAQNVQVVHNNAMANIAYAGGALLEQIFAATMTRLAALAADPFAGAVASGTNPDPFAGAHASAENFVRGIVNSQVARMQKDASR